MIEKSLLNEAQSEHSYQTPYFFYQFGSKKPTFTQIAKALLHQTPYFNFTIPFFNISLLLLLFFFTTPEILHYKKHYYTKKKSFLFPQLMNSGSLRWESDSSSTTTFQWFGEADGYCFCCLLPIFCCFRPNTHSDKNAHGALNQLCRHYIHSFNFQV